MRAKVEYFCRSKVRKKGQKRIRQPRFAFMTKSEVDHLEDGYRWRKYGQKAVKNSPFPRRFHEFIDKRCPEIKGIAAYRSGLEINPYVTKEDAEIGLSEVLQSGKLVCITNKSFIDYIFTHSLEVALQFDLPMQIHTGFGDKDLDLRLSNPLYLRTLLEDKRFYGCRIVLLHASYPFLQEVSYLASVYAQVYLDFGLAIPKLSVHGMISSVMFSTDAYATPETYYIGLFKLPSIDISSNSSRMIVLLNLYLVSNAFYC
ncbi:Glutamate-ammonia ligase [Gossypium australe]|uniref:Glutamate-ammonia ligase n=1 Tax=Gossypium australe TaxID=47621 RepID=A0A5B6WRK1_9ROSI|nr:Glutamate-ammonia ligase [Gossypium australe]